MSEPVLTAMPWRRRMAPRDPDEAARASTPLELFFDLCFVVAVAQNGLRLEHALAEGHFANGVISYLLVFFAIWWAWVNFSWFASAYDADDVPYRLSTMGVMAGVLILAAGVPRAFDDRDFAVVFLGYAVIRLGLEVQRLRAARSDPAGRATMLRYAAGEIACMAGWAVVIFALPKGVQLLGWLVVAAAELVVPVWAERAGRLPWHRHHIAERYGLFTIIVLGETILAATNAVRGALDEKAGAGLLFIAAGGLIIVFGLWWVYFSMAAAEMLTDNQTAFRWGYGHYVIFASGAAVGAGLAVNVARATHHAELSTAAAGATVTVPVFCYLVVVWFFMVRPHGPDAPYHWTIPLIGLLVLAATFTGAPVPVAGLLLGVLIALSVVLHAGKTRMRSPGPARPNA